MALTIGAAAHAADRFTDNGDGTVTDHDMGLMWAKNDNHGDINWHQADKWVRYTFPYTLPTMYDNWRLPTLEELQSLVREGRGYENRLRPVGEDRSGYPAELRVDLELGNRQPGPHGNRF